MVFYGDMIAKINAYGLSNKIFSGLIGKLIGIRAKFVLSISNQILISYYMILTLDQNGHPINMFKILFKSEKLKLCLGLA